MKTFLIFLLAFVPLFLFAQSKTKAEAAFVAELNAIINNSTQQHWAYEGEKMTIDSAFAISKNGILSVTISYINNEGKKTITRTEAPVNRIERVAYDLYLILEFEDAVVSSFYAKDGSSEFKASEKENYFHIGAPLPEYPERQILLQKLLDNLLKHYKKI